MSWYKPWRQDDEREKDARASAAAAQAQLMEAENRRRATESARLMRSSHLGASRPANASMARGRTILTGVIGILGGGGFQRTLGGPT